MTHRAYPIDIGPGSGALNWVLVKCDCGWAAEKEVSDDILRYAIANGVPCEAEKPTANAHKTGTGTLWEDIA